MGSIGGLHMKEKLIVTPTTPNEWMWSYSTNNISSCPLVRYCVGSVIWHDSWSGHSLIITHYQIKPETLQNNLDDIFAVLFDQTEQQPFDLGLWGWLEVGWSKLSPQLGWSQVWHDLLKWTLFSYGVLKEKKLTNIFTGEDRTKCTGVAACKRWKCELSFSNLLGHKEFLDVFLR